MSKKRRCLPIENCIGDCPHAHIYGHTYWGYCELTKKRIENSSKHKKQFPKHCPLRKVK